MKSRIAFSALTLCLIAIGCSHEVKEPGPPTDHPANPHAAEADASMAAPTVYTCPEHPKVMQAEPGDCPICGMKLVPSASRNTSPLRGANLAPASTPAPSEHDGEHHHE